MTKGQQDNIQKYINRKWGMDSKSAPTTDPAYSYYSVDIDHESP